MRTLLIACAAAVVVVVCLVALLSFGGTSSSAGGADPLSGEDDQPYIHLRVAMLRGVFLEEPVPIKLRRHSLDKKRTVKEYQTQPFVVDMWQKVAPVLRAAHQLPDGRRVCIYFEDFEVQGDKVRYRAGGYLMNFGSAYPGGRFASRHGRTQHNDPPRKEARLGSSVDIHVASHGHPLSHVPGGLSLRERCEFRVTFVEVLPAREAFKIDDGLALAFPDEILADMKEQAELRAAP